MPKIHTVPQAIFDTLHALERNEAPVPTYVDQDDYRISKSFLLAYAGSQDTFHSYRREVDRFLQWVYLIAQKTLRTINREDIENFMYFCQKPADDWITSKMAPRFIEKNGKKIPNEQWRPFVVKVTKEAHQQAKKPSIKRYRLSDQGVQAILRILSTYYSFLEMEDYTQTNPVKRVRQKSKFIRQRTSVQQVRRLSPLQWDYVIESTKQLAKHSPSFERSLFILCALYGLYLRISELADTARWSPTMNDFFQDDQGAWWFKTVGKGNKERDISVSEDLLRVLKHYRQSMGLSPLPSPSDNTPLIPKQKGNGGIKSTRQLRDIVQHCFDEAVYQLQAEGMEDDANRLKTATVHWLRHTGISDDVKHRPKEHVRDDAGHSSSAITDRYIDIEKRDRHASARQKKINPKH
ncbi:site-specific integrase [bacterium AH-315-K03]|nr:site-specific integrase [bacterium AH-315-K03]